MGKETKVCAKCGRELAITDFYYHNRKENRRRNICKHCYIERQCVTGGEVHHRVKLHTVKPEAKTEDQPKPKKKRVANGQGDRSQYTHKYYITHKAKLKAKNHADYINRKLDEQVVCSEKPVTPVRTCKGSCIYYPCFTGIENIESNLSVTCHGFKERANA